MQTVYDWVTIALFAGLIVIFLQRSMGTQEARDSDNPWRYLPPSIALAVANYFGNEGHGVVAWVIIVGVLAYIQLVIKPFPLKG